MASFLRKGTEENNPIMVAAAYNFNRDEINMITHAAARLGVNIWNVADKVYGWCILDHWDRSDWSVNNIMMQYEQLVREYH